MDSCTDVWVVRITGGWKEKGGLAFHNIHIYLVSFIYCSKHAVPGQT